MVVEGGVFGSHGRLKDRFFIENGLQSRRRNYVGGTIIM